MSADLKAFVGAVSWPDKRAATGKVTMIFTVLTSTSQQARALITQKVERPDATVKIKDELLADTAAERLKLRPEEPVEISSGM